MKNVFAPFVYLLSPKKIKSEEAQKPKMAITKM
jgi:hypothetical protein